MRRPSMSDRLMRGGKTTTATLMVMLGFGALTFCGCAFVPAPHGIPNFSQVAPGVWRGGQPTVEGWEYLKSLGVQRVVKLNTEHEASDEWATTNGIEVIHLPITLAQQTIGKPGCNELNLAVSALEREGTFVHCQHGQDRTGLVIGAYRVKVGHWMKIAAYREMKANGFHPLLRGLCWSWQEDVVESAHFSQCSCTRDK